MCGASDTSCLGERPELGASDQTDPPAEPQTQAAVGEALLPDPAADADAPPEAAAWKSHYGWRQIGFDLRYIVTRPAHMGAPGWWKVGATVVTAGLLYSVRYDIRDWSQEHRDRRGSVLQDARTTGKGLFIPVMSLSFYLASFAGNRSVSARPR